jgi:hypothetical protein
MLTYRISVLESGDPRSMPCSESCKCLRWGDESLGTIKYLDRPWRQQGVKQLMLKERPLCLSLACLRRPADPA